MSDEVDEMSAGSRGSHGDTGIMSWEQADQIMQEQRAEIERLRLREEEAGAILRQVGWIQRMLAKWPDRDKEGDLLRIDHAALLALLERTK